MRLLTLLFVAAVAASAIAQSPPKTPSAAPTPAECCPCPPKKSKAISRPPKASLCPPCEPVQTCNGDYQSGKDQGSANGCILKLPRVPIVVKQEVPSRSAEKHGEKEHSDRRQHSRWTDPVALFTLLLVGVGFMQAVVLYRQSQHTEAVERPWLTPLVRPLRRPPDRPDLPDVPDIFAVLAKTLIYAAGAIRNTGKTVGWLTRAYSRMFYVPHPLDAQEPKTEDAVRNLKEVTPDFALPPGSEMEHSFVEVHELTPEQHRAIRRGEASIVFFIFSEYRRPQPTPLRWLRWVERAEPRYDSWFAWEWTWAKNARVPNVLVPTSQPADNKVWTRYT